MKSDAELKADIEKALDELHKTAENVQKIQNSYFAKFVGYATTVLSFGLLLLAGYQIYQDNPLSAVVAGVLFLAIYGVRFFAIMMAGVIGALLKSQAEEGKKLLK